jgi:hypothetical protein
VRPWLANFATLGSRERWSSLELESVSADWSGQPSASHPCPSSDAPYFSATPDLWSDHHFSITASPETKNRRWAVSFSHSSVVVSTRGRSSLPLLFLRKTLCLKQNPFCKDSHRLYQSEDSDWNHDNLKDENEKWSHFLLFYALHAYICILLSNSSLSLWIGFSKRKDFAFRTHLFDWKCSSRL